MADADASSEPKIHVSPAAARTLITNVLCANRVPHANAQLVAEKMVAADLRGIDTHGMNRLPSYVERIRQGVLDPTASPTLTHLTPCCASIDGHNAFGHLSASLGMTTACDMASTYGIGLVSIAHSNHFGMSAWVVQQALDRGFMSLVFTNSSPAMPAWGGREKILGVSPIACGAPSSSGQVPFVLDMAPSVAARGKVYKAKRRGEKIPLDWALDAQGRRTEDPEQALQGTMLPMGGPKGSGLSIMMDVFSGVFSGSAFAGGVANPYDPSRKADVGHFLVVIKPGLFVGEEEFRERMKVLYETVVGGERMEGCDRIWFPGEIELEESKRRENEGIPLVKAELEALNGEARKVGVGEMEVMKA